MPHGPEYSEGARVERAAYRRHLRRAMKDPSRIDDLPALTNELRWVLGRVERYEQRPGGLGERSQRKGVS